MSIFSRPLSDDIRTAHRLVELTCLALEKPKFAQSDVIPLVQCFRFLEMYRYDAFDWRDAHSHEDQFERRGREQGQEGMRTALHKAGETVFPGLTPEQVAVPIEEALSLFYKGKRPDLTSAKLFFTQLQIELETLMNT